MLAQAKESRLYLSNQLMVDFNDPSNSDTSFTAVLGSIFECRRIVLGSAFIENYFINLNDLSLTLDGIFYDIKPQFFLTQSTLIAFLNDTVGGEHFSYGNTLPTYDTRLELVCDQLFSLQGLSWYRQLGFALNQTGFDQIAETVYSFAQSPFICIQLQNLPSAVQNGSIFSFQIPNVPGVYGSSLSLNQMNFNSTNMVVFDSPQKFYSLSVRLLDQYGQILRTPNNNKSNIQVAMMLSCYSE